MDIIKKAVIAGFCLSGLAVTAYAEEGYIVGYYSCRAVACNFVTQGAGTFDFNVMDKKSVSKILKSCKADEVCAVIGSFDVVNSHILQVTKVENSGLKYN